MSEGLNRTRVVILGGGTAGWMTAAQLVAHLPHACSVQLVESEEIGIVGVGEATLPQLRYFLEGLGIDEAEFMQATHATFKLGVDFRDFGRPGTRYLHPFGVFGQAYRGVPFHHYWLRLHAERRGGSLFDCNLSNVMAGMNRFSPPPAGPAATYSYAYQFDATLFGPYLRNYAIARGAVRTEGRVVEAERDGENGDVRALKLESGERVEGDLFVDCSGFRALLIGAALAEPWEDWSGWLPCDRAVAVPCSSPPGPIEPYTRATGMAAGWRWRIPLQHRVGNGYVYSSAHLSDDEAAEALLAGIEGPRLAEPRVLRFRAGRRRRSWSGNVVAVGLASGFLEPLESTSIYLVQAAVEQLTELFPVGRIRPEERDAFNEALDAEYDRIRDFLILHYHATERAGSPFWDHVRTMDVPDSLAERMELWRHSGRVARYFRGLFPEASWVSVYVGQGVIPRRWDQRADLLSTERLEGSVARLREHIRTTVSAMPGHGEFIARRNATAGRPAG